jgi:tetratricopeptide (TPR) repeat protein
MKHFLHPIWIAILLALIVSTTLREASAGEVRAGVSSRETYAGLPVTLQIQISNASSYDPPTNPEVDGLKITSLGTPARSTQITSINGNTTRSTSVTYSYSVTPQRTGSFRIPPITVLVDGRAQQTPAFEFVASKSETGDLLFVEIAGKENEIYVGQALDLTLKIWLRPYRDADRDITLSEADMWQMISDRTSWGAFADRMQQLAEEGKRPAGQEVLRKDRDGVEHSYYRYEIEATIYPQRPGRIEANDVQIVVSYPTALGQSRDPFGSFFDDMRSGGRGGAFGSADFPSPFGSRLTVQSVRPIVAEAAVEPIEVRPIPTAGRPADYRGAVGTYAIATEASPTNVKAGDPINLLIGIAGTGPMELVQAPPLAELPDLTADFKVPNEPLAGFVQGERKAFSTSIRPRNEGVTQIPAIPFSYFDPESDKFVTVHSQPITIHVGPADTLALDAVVGRSKSAAAVPHGADVAEASPSLAIVTSDDLLTSESLPVLGSRQLVLLLAMPPLVVLVILLARTGGGMSRFAARFGSSHRRFQTQIENAEHPAEVAGALQSHLATRFGINAATADAAAVVGGLRSAGYRLLAIRCERILGDSTRETVASGIGGRRTLSELKHDALQLVDDLQAEGRLLRAKPLAVSRKPAPSKFKAPRVRTTPSAVVAAVVLAGALTIGGVASAATPALLSAEPTTPSSSPLSLALEQRETLLTEANDGYNQALSTAAEDSADAKQAFADAAEKYQLLVDAGVANSRLYFNLGNAYLESGQTGRAIANYRRSLRLGPTSRAARTNLAYAESLLNPRAAAAESSGDADSLAGYVSMANGWLNRYVSPRRVLAIMFVAWVALWAAIGVRLLGLRFPWKSMAATGLVVAALSATSYVLSCQELDKNVAVVVLPDTTLRVGDGRNFATVADAALHEGQSVELVKRRGDWLQVRTQSGQTGWLSSPAVETI